MALVVAVTGVIAYSAASGRRVRAPQNSPAASVASARVPSSYQVLQKVGPRLVISGGPAGSPLGPALSWGVSTSGAARCQSAAVNMATLALGGRRSGPCQDPGVFYERALPIAHAVPGVVNGSTLRFAQSLASGGYRLGPVVTRWTDVAGAEPKAAYGGGYVWVYVPLSQDGGEVISMSVRTGHERKVKAPEVASPLLAAGQGGLWFSGRASLAPPFEPGVYFIAARAGVARLVVRAAGVSWLVGSGKQAFFGTRTHVFKLEGAEVVGEWAQRTSGAAFAASPEGYLWVLSGWPCEPTVAEVDLKAGTVREVASLRLPTACAKGASPVLVSAGKYLWALLRWANSPFSYLYRLTPQP